MVELGTPHAITRLLASFAIAAFAWLTVVAIGSSPARASDERMCAAVARGLRGENVFTLIAAAIRACEPDDVTQLVNQDPGWKSISGFAIGALCRLDRQIVFTSDGDAVCVFRGASRENVKTR